MGPGQKTQRPVFSKRGSYVGREDYRRSRASTDKLTEEEVLAYLAVSKYQIWGKQTSEGLHGPNGRARQLLLAHLSQRLIGELIGYPWSGVRRRPSSSVRRKQFQTSSSQKPLGRSKPNFMWSLLG